MAENDLAIFYRMMLAVDREEQAIVDAQKRLDNGYDWLVFKCPHSEAVDKKNTLQGVGTTRRCKICGITDYASEGGTAGDEINYGYPGHPSRSFWEGAEVEVVDETEFHKYNRSHQWVVSGGKPRKRFV